MSISEKNLSVLAIERISPEEIIVQRGTDSSLALFRDVDRKLKEIMSGMGIILFKDATLEKSLPVIMTKWVRTVQAVHVKKKATREEIDEFKKKVTRFHEKKRAQSLSTNLGSAKFPEDEILLFITKQFPFKEGKFGPWGMIKVHDQLGAQGIIYHSHITSRLFESTWYKLSNLQDATSKGGDSTGEMKAD